MRSHLVRKSGVFLICLLLLTTFSASGAQASPSFRLPSDSEETTSASTWPQQVQPSARELGESEPSGFRGATVIEGPRVTLIHDDRYIPHHVPPPSHAALEAQTAELEVSFNPTRCNDEGSVSPWPQDAKDAFQFAVDIWSTLLNSSQTIVIDACWISNLPSSVLGAAGALAFYRGFPSHPVPDTWYPVALANALARDDLNDTDPEIIALFSSTFDWYYGTDGNTPRDKVDFASVVVHELCHGLGFIGSMDYDDGIGYAECNGLAGRGCWGFGTGYPFIYDRFTEDGNGTSLLDYTSSSTALGNALKGQVGSGVYFDGLHANAANTRYGQSPVKLYAPSTWRPGSSYSHLDEIFNGTPNSLMTYSLANGESEHSPGPITLGMFQDMGWTTGGDNSTVHVYLPSMTRGWPPTQLPGVVNGDFEDERTGWTEYSDSGSYLIVTDFPSGVTPHSGSWAAWLGWAHQDTSYVEQQVTVPPGGPYIGYWHWISSADFCGSDFARVVIDGSTVDRYDLCTSENTGGWVKHVVDLNAYAGQTVELRIQAETDSVLRSNLFVDDVAFQTSAPAMHRDSTILDTWDGVSASGTD